MAAVHKPTVPLLLPVTLVFFVLGSLLTPALCRHPAAHARAAATASLDVSAALAGTSAVLSVDPAFQQEAESSSPQSAARSSPSGAFLSLQLHPRESVKKRFINDNLATSAAATHHKDYRSLTLSRLRRDAARVHGISARVSLAVDGVHHSKLRPEKHQEKLLRDAVGAAAAGASGKASAFLMPEAMQGPVVSGTSQGSGEYFSRVGIGRPAKELYVVLDTGSDVTWVQCQPCSDCYQQADPVYDPASSSSYSTLGCDSEQCKALDLSACRNSSCLYQVSYGDGSYTVGDFATETMSFGSAVAANGSSVPGVAFGCGHDNEGLFVGAAGLLGLGGGTLSFPSQIAASSFSYCLVDRDSSGTSTLDFGRGGAAVDDPSVSASAVTAPLIRNRKLDTFYYVGLTGISVGGRMLSIPASAFSMDEAGNGGVIVDSGTAVTRLNPEAYTPLRDAFKAATSGLPAAEGVALFDTCYDLSGRESVEVPTVGLHFSENGGAAGPELRLPAKNYLIPVDSSGTFCLAFAPAGSSSGLSIIGNVQQQGIRVSFDLDNHRVGFAANQC